MFPELKNMRLFARTAAFDWGKDAGIATILAVRYCMKRSARENSTINPKSAGISVLISDTNAKAGTTA
jgi:hypothetical protein